MRRTAIAALCATLAAGCAGQETSASGSKAAAPATAPAGEYRLDKSHASLVFRVDHVGFSNYTAKFGDFDAVLQFDPERPERMSVAATIDPASLTLDHPPEGFLQTMLDDAWLGAGAFPQMSYRSTKITRTGERTARIDGQFSFHGVTQAVELDATFNGGYPGMAVYDPQARIGFSVHGALMRSDFGVDQGLRPPGSTMGVSDRVEFQIEAEFVGPPLEAVQ
jgi:polyisoprenoid-binding protein YceI